MQSRVGWYGRVAGMVLVLTATWAAIRVLGLARVLQRIETRTKGRPISPMLVSDQASALAETTSLIRTASRVCPAPCSCLVRSVALLWWARRSGAQAELVMGVPYHMGPDFEAHAWIESRGEVINDSPDVRHRYAALGRGRD